MRFVSKYGLAAIHLAANHSTTYDASWYRPNPVLLSAESTSKTASKETTHDRAFNARVGVLLDVRHRIRLWLTSMLTRYFDLILPSFDVATAVLGTRYILLTVNRFEALVRVPALGFSSFSRKSS